MGKSLFNKLGNIWRVFKGGKKKEIDKSDDDVNIISSSESELKGSEISSQQQVEFFNNLQARISKSIDNLSTTTDPLNNEFNKLKRTQGTCDILEATQDEELKIIQSLDRFSHLKNTNSLVLYNAKLYNSTIWSQALGRALEREINKVETTSVSTIQTEVTLFRKGTDSVDSYSTLQTISERRGLGDLVVHHKATENDSTEIIYTQSERSGTSSEETHKTTSNSRISEETLKSPEVYTELIEPQVFTVTQTDQELMVKVSEVIASTSYSSEVVLEKKTVEVGVDAEPLRNKLSSDVQICTNRVSDEDMNDEINDENTSITVENSTPKLLPSSATEYEVVNLTQVDLFKEFKTTIAKMRNVLNVLEDKKSLKRIAERRTNDQKMNERITAHLERKNNGHISTQTAIMTYNQISTSTDAGPSNPPKSEGVMVQISSDTPSKCNANSKTITLDSALFNYVKPLEKIRRRKRCKKVRRNRYDRKKPTDIPIPTKSSKRVEKSQYNKCIVYHITQHKNAMDRCVGTPLYSTKKDSLVLHNTFSALHFGPISEFPAILNKHENEVNKRKQLKFKVNKKKDPTTTKSYLPDNDNFNREACINSTTTTTTTANWMVFEPPAPLMLQNNQSTSDEIILDRNKSSTQEMISRLLDEEFKTSGLKGKVSSNTMNLIKDQFCDKLSGVKTKDIPDIMVTVCVPLKEIVSKIKTTKKPSHEDKAVEYDPNESLIVKNQPSCDMGVQVTLSKKDINDNLQTIPEKISKSPYEIYQQNKLLRRSTSYNKLSSFKKIFLSKNSSSNIDSSGQNYPKPSRIFFSDHSTSSPQFLTKRTLEKNVATKRNSNEEIRRYRNESNVNLKRLKEGFFLNLPPNRFKKKRAQISKLFDGSDSSDRKYSGDPKLLYHVHDSSFYSSSKTDERFTTQKSKKNLHQESTSCFPLQQVASKADIKVKPKFISFSDFLVRDEVEEERKKNIGKVERRKKLKKFKNADMNTSVEEVCQDSFTQYDNSIFTPQTQPTGAETGVNNVDEECSVIQKVRFEDDVEPKKPEVKNKDHKNGKRRKKNVEPKEAGDKTESTSNGDSSILSLFEETHTIPKKISIDVGIQKSFHELPAQSSVKQISTAICTVPELPRTPIATRSEVETNEQLLELKKSREETKECSSHNMVVVDDQNLNTQNNFKDLIKNIVSVCNTSFIKSRDCIVELTIYNLIKEIILDHCSHLTEQSKKKVETILANFVQDCKSRSGNQDIKIVESAIENLVKEIDSKTFVKTKENDKNKEDNVSEYQHKSRSKSRHHKHKSKHHSHHRDQGEHHHESRHRSKKRHHKHNCENDDKCDLWKEETEKEFRTVDGRKEYLELIKRLKELETVTKQLSSVARKQQPQQAYYMEGMEQSTNQQVYTVLTDSPKISMSKKKMKLSLSNFHQRMNPVNMSYVQTELNQPVVPIPRNVPKLPVTKIVINLSNLKLLTKNCASIPSSIEDPLVLTDSTEEKRKIMNQFISFEMENNVRNTKHLSHHTLKESNEKFSLQNDVVHRKKELFTITIHGNKSTKNEESNDKKDFMRIKMCRKNRTITSSSEQTTSDSYSTKIYRGKTLGMKDIHRITKEYVKRELKSKNDVLCSDIARDLLENKCDVGQVLRKEEDIEAAHQRMANFCLFRNLLKKPS